MKILTNILKLRHESEESISSLPALIMMAEKISASTVHGMHAQRKAGTGEKFWQFRDYQQTDRPQDIDWRQSAKTDNIFIKQKELQTTQKTYIWCAGGASMDFSSNSANHTKQESAQIIALSLALLMRKSEELIGVFGDTKAGKSEEKIEKIGQYLLDRATTGEELPSSMHYSIPNHASFIGIGDFLSPIEEIRRSLSPIASNAKNALIVQILDPSEMDLPYQGRVRFRGLHHNEVELINNVPSIRQDYKRRIEAHIKQIKYLCQDQHWSYILHRTDTDIADTLRDIWMIMNNGVVQK